MDGNSFDDLNNALKYKVKIRPLMDGNQYGQRYNKFPSLKSDH